MPSTAQPPAHCLSALEKRRNGGINIDVTGILKRHSIANGAAAAASMETRSVVIDSELAKSRELLAASNTQVRNILMNKPTRLRNLEAKPEVYDKLHCKGAEILSCTKTTCLSSIMNFKTVQVEAREPEEVLEQAKDFIEQYYTSLKKASSPAHEARWKEVQQSTETTGKYHLTEAELEFGAKLAWRNASRCIGRIQWSKLKLFDRRNITTTQEMFDAICNHVKYSTNKGNIRSAITVFPQRTDPAYDYRIWNSQLISYAGYKQANGEYIGDPMNAEFTEVCLKLGWKSKGTEWDILPLVVSAKGQDPDLFEYPEDLILQVHFSHPKYDWFAEMGLRWYAVPAVSGMLFDIGGIQFTATAFSGWYMSTEIGCRNLCDSTRRNVLEQVAVKMNLDTRTPTTLWKDRALVEVNLAVLHSFQTNKVTIIDHHSASENFMKHYENESKNRNGCPADWIWIVPPMSGSITPVYHQEMATYYLKPSYDYQHPAWRVHVWEKDRGVDRTKKQKFNFKQIARAVLFTSVLYTRALSKRIRATVLYATETGKSEQYAKQLCELLTHAFNVQIHCMADYDISMIAEEDLLLVVTSTFGNGDAPDNGEQFSQDLYALRVQESLVNSRRGSTCSNGVVPTGNSRRGSDWLAMASDSNYRPLSNVRFAVFALGSSTYPNFCAFGEYVDNILGQLGASRLIKVAYGDEMCGQEDSFRKWAPDVVKHACVKFGLNVEESLNDATLALQSESYTIDNVRWESAQVEGPLEQLLSKYHNKKVRSYKIKATPRNLTKLDEKSTILVEIYAPGLDYEPGDHVGIYPVNRKEIVDGLLRRLTGVEDADKIVQLQVMKEKQTPNGIFECWEPHEKIPAESIRNLLSHFFDITTPPSRDLLALLSDFCEDIEDTKRMLVMVNDFGRYEDWRQWRQPHLLDVLQQFPSCKPPATLVLANLMPLQARFYSISSSPRKVINEIHLTVAIVQYRSEDGKGAQRYGVCSNFLAGLVTSEPLHMFVRKAPGFHMPADTTRPLVLIGPGTGIAPFRSFWQELEVLRDMNLSWPKTWLFFGGRNRDVDLYAEEKEQLVREKILDRTFLALSRVPNMPKTYVQHLIEREIDALHKMIVEEEGHIYVCGDVTMAEQVYQTIRKCIARKEGKTDAEVEVFLMALRHENRYHEDIFGATSNAAEVRSKSLATALRRASET